MTSGPNITAWFDEATCSVSYLVADPGTGTAAIIDPVLDFDLASGHVDTRSADAILTEVETRGLTVAWLLETHPHADHLSAAAHLKQKTGAPVAIGAGIVDVKGQFGALFDAAAGGRDFDRLLEDGERLSLGSLEIEVLATPGHTPACVSYRIGDAVFVGDTLFMPDYGTARADFPGGDARQLYLSIRRLLSLPRETRLFMCHDYKAPGRDTYAWETTAGEEADRNLHIGGGVSEEDFVAMRMQRDATLCAPKLLYPAIQVNIRAGKLPEPAANGQRFLKLPLSS